MGLLQEIARNDWMIVTRDQRKVILDRYKQRRTITASENRQVVSDLMGRIRERVVADSGQRARGMEADRVRNALVGTWNTNLR